MSQYLTDLQALYVTEPDRYRCAELSPTKALIDRRDRCWFPVRYGASATNPLPEASWKNAVLGFASEIGQEVCRMIGKGGYETVADFFQQASTAAGLGQGDTGNTLEMNWQFNVGRENHAYEVVQIQEALSMPWQGAINTNQVLRFQVYWSGSQEAYSEEDSVWLCNWAHLAISNFSTSLDLIHNFALLSTGSLKRLKNFPWWSRSSLHGLPLFELAPEKDCQGSVDRCTVNPYNPVLQTRNI